MTEGEMIQFMLSGEGRLTAAGLLWFAVLLSRRMPWLEEKLRTPWHKRAYAGALSLLPALSLGLAGRAPWAEVLTTAGVAFLGATGLNRLVGGNPPPALPRSGPTSPG